VGLRGLEPRTSSLSGKPGVCAAITGLPIDLDSSSVNVRRRVSAARVVVTQLDTQAAECRNLADHLMRRVFRAVGRPGVCRLISLFGCRERALLVNDVRGWTAKIRPATTRLDSRVMRGSARTWCRQARHRTYPNLIEKLAHRL
jgi:hypothetical protein